MAYSDYPWQELLRFIYSDGRRWLASIPRTDWRRILIPEHGVIAALNVQIISDEKELIAHLDRVSQPSDVGRRRAIVLRPCNHDPDALLVLVPFVLAVNPGARISLQLGVYSANGKHSTFCGYRFESPERGEEHQFYHVQPINAFGHGGALACGIQWYPGRYPAFPVVAEDQAELVVTIFVSVREWSKLRELSSSRSISMDAKEIVTRVMERIRPRPKKVAQ
jgi:hypothetical protein